jgi:DUF2075 family protein
MPKCGAILECGDDYGDNSATFHCQLEYQHTGPHKEVFRDSSVRIEWDKDERTMCTCGHESYCHRLDEESSEYEECEKTYYDEYDVGEPCLCTKYVLYTGPAKD